MMGLEEHDDGIYVNVRWRGLPRSEDTLEPLLKIYQDVPQMLLKLLSRKSLPKALKMRAKTALQLASEKGV